MYQRPVLPFNAALYVGNGCYRQSGSAQAAAALLLGGRRVEYPAIVGGR
jgi:hypothetical protein